MKTIDICGVPFTVQIVDPSQLEAPDDGGCIDEHSRQILLNSKLAEMQSPVLWDTLGHEWVHGVLGRTGFADLLDNPKVEEGICTAIGVALMQLLKGKGLDGSALLTQEADDLDRRPGEESPSLP